MKLWQLKNLQTNEVLNEPQPLPDNWGPIFGLSGFLEKLGDLSWLGPSYENLGWFEVGDAPEVEEPSVSVEVSKEEEVMLIVNRLLNETLANVAVDNIEMTKQERFDWMEYRRLLKEIPLQPDFPEIVYWPARPE